MSHRRPSDSALVNLQSLGCRPNEILESEVDDVFAGVARHVAGLLGQAIESGLVPLFSQTEKGVNVLRIVNTRASFG